MMKWLIISMAAFTILSCGKVEKIPANIIKPEKMEKVLWDYLKADSYSAEIIKKDTSQNDTLVNLKLQKTIFNHYGISAETFYRSYDYYISHPEKMTPILDSISAKRDRLGKMEIKPFIKNDYE